MKYASVICVLSYMTGATDGTGIAYSSGTTWVIPVFSGPCVDRSTFVNTAQYIYIWRIQNGIICQFQIKKEIFNAIMNFKVYTCIC